jgi:anti-sigma B factor antagonist
MKIENFGQRLSISEIQELTAVNSANFRDEVNTALTKSPKVVEIDLSQTRFVDSSGLGALFALYRSTGQGSGVVLRLLNPAPEIQQLLELTQMQQLFEIVQR